MIPSRLWVSDINPETLANLSANLGINVSHNNLEVIPAVDVVVLAVKPQVLAQVAKEICPCLAPKPIGRVDCCRHYPSQPK